MAREFSKRFYNSKAWNDLAKLIREQRHYICDRCGKPGATQVHHIIELTPDNINDPSVSLNPRNLQLLCHECHNAIHGRFREAGGRSYTYDSTGHVVAVGVPGKSGKRRTIPPG
ncbi:HNH endonuclease [Acidaminococcus provencensis]|uniref:HNH endonuclease n=1 Tax=Acidaminococcus provencensis TaxID=2058289 RepID=UPI0022E2A4E7|nr:HNH endonuclease signature motif containing protein [Acidaminococcus provencensis]